MTRVDRWDSSTLRSKYTSNREGIANGKSHVRVAQTRPQPLKAVDRQRSMRGVSCSRHEHPSRQQLFGDSESLLRAGKPEGAHQRAPFLLLGADIGPDLGDWLRIEGYEPEVGHFLDHLGAAHDSL